MSQLVSFLFVFISELIWEIIKGRKLLKGRYWTSLVVSKAQVELKQSWYILIEETICMSIISKAFNFVLV